MTPTGLLQSAHAAADRGEHEQAVAFMVRLTTLVFDKPEFWVIRGNHEWDAGQMNAALSSFRQALLLDPCRIYAHERVGQTLEKLGDHAGAEAHLRKAVGLGGKARSMILLEVFHAGQGRRGEAIAEYERAIDIGGDVEDAHRNLAAAYRRQDPERSLGHLLAALELCPGDAGLVADLGRLQYLMGDLRSGLQNLMKSISMGRDSAETLVHVADVLDDLGQLDLALDYCDRAVRVDPDSEFAIEALGFCHAFLGNWEPAARYLKVALEKGRENPAALEQLVRALRELDRDEEAQDLIVEYRRLVEE